MAFTRKCAALSYHVHSPYCIIFKCIFLNENVWISIKISLKFVPKDPIINFPPVFQVMAWCRLGDKPLSEPMVVNLLTHLCVTRPQWLKNKKECNKRIKARRKLAKIGWDGLLFFTTVQIIPEGQWRMRSHCSSGLFLGVNRVEQTFPFLSLKWSQLPSLSHCCEIKKVPTCDLTLHKSYRA